MGFKKYSPSRNLFDYIYYFNHTSAGVNVYFNLKGIITLEANTTYTFSTNFMSKTTGTRETPFIACKHNDTPTTANGGFGNDASVTITTDATGMIDLYTRTLAGGTQSDVDIPTLSDFQNGKWVMLNEGSTALPYEPYGNIWQPINPKQLKGIPYTGTLPAVLTRTKAGYLHRYKIYGNLTQNGTPTPENPIYPSECGERTENEAWTGWAQDFVTRIDDSTKARLETIDGRTCLLFVVSAGTGAYDSKYLFKTSWKETTRYTFSFEALRLSTESTASVMQVWYTDGSSEYFPRTINSGAFESYTFTTAVDKTVKYITPLFSSGAFRIDIGTFMVSEGSTALPYEPYGYKLPLTSGSTPVDIYLGESQTTRRIKKLVLTGEEDWRIDSGRFTLTINDMKSQGLRLTEFYCSSYQVISDGRAYADVPNNAIYTGAAGSYGTYIYIHTDEYTTTTSFKAYLAQQYANGTPVTIWYVLATEETGILNEPLRKIGNYADTVDSTQTSAQIPTSATSTTISWGGQGLEPSQFDSIQEWVDIPTYTYTNGEWVADN